MPNPHNASFRERLTSFPTQTYTRPSYPNRQIAQTAASVLHQCMQPYFPMMPMNDHPMTHRQHPDNVGCAPGSSVVTVSRFWGSWSRWRCCQLATNVSTPGDCLHLPARSCRARVVSVKCLRRIPSPCSVKARCVRRHVRIIASRCSKFPLLRHSIPQSRSPSLKARRSARQSSTSLPEFFLWCLYLMLHTSWKGDHWSAVEDAKGLSRPLNEWSEDAPRILAR